MRKRPNDSLSAIEAGAINVKSDLPTLLRMCISLSGVTRSDELRKWASSELMGYGPDDELPNYRTSAAPLLLDGTTRSHRVTGQSVPVNLVPSDMHDVLDEDVRFAQPIAEILDLIERSRRSSEDFVRIGPPGSHYLVALMNHELQGAAIDRIYWSVSVATLHRIVDAVRTTLVRLVAEMRVAMPVGVLAPSQEVADNAVAVVVHGSRNRINVQHISSSTGDVVATQADNVMVGSQPEPPVRKFTYWLFGIATLSGTIITVVVWRWG